MTGCGPKVHAVRVHQHYCRLDVTCLSIDRFAQPFQDICQASPAGDHFQGPFFGSQQCLGALTILDICIRSIPFEDAAVIVAYGFYTEQEPAILSLVPPQACFNLTGLARIQQVPPKILDPVPVFCVKSCSPAPTPGPSSNQSVASPPT